MITIQNINKIIRITKYSPFKLYLHNKKYQINHQKPSQIQNAQAKIIQQQNKHSSADLNNKTNHASWKNNKTKNQILKWMGLNCSILILINRILSLGDLLFKMCSFFQLCHSLNLSETLEDGANYVQKWFLQWSV